MILNKLSELETESLMRKIPIIGREKGTWLLQKVKEMNPKKILELGSANGYSGCILGSYGAELTTIELDTKMAHEAVTNFFKFNIKAKVLVGDATKLVKELKDSFDLVFIDFAKKSYLKILEDCVRLTKYDGLIIADNITMSGCQDFKGAIMNHSQLKTEIIKIKDGLSCSVKKS